MPIRRTTILTIGIFFILLGCVDILLSSVNNYGIQYLRIITIGLPLFGGLGLILKRRTGWVFCMIYSLNYVIVVVYNLLMNHPISGIVKLGHLAFFGVIITFVVLTGLTITAIVYLNKSRIKENYRIKRITQQLSIGLGIVLAITNILI